MNESVAIVTGASQGIGQATASFPKEAGIARYGEPQEIAELMAFLVSPARNG